MTIDVLFFAGIKEALGQAHRVLEVSEGACIGEVIDQMSREADGHVLKTIPLVFAVNEYFESGNRELKDGDRLAVMTAMSGG